jgi:ectoine hydroxylase
MKLSDDQVDRFERDGYVFLPEAKRLFALEREEVWREDNGAPRTAFAAHLYSEPFRRLGAHPRLIAPLF